MMKRKGFEWVSFNCEWELLPFCNRCSLFDNRPNFPCTPDEDPMACAALDLSRKRLYYIPKAEGE